MEKKDYIGAGIVFITPKGKILLLQKRNGKLTFPGGHKEPYETSPLKTAQRECEEELGYLPDGKMLGKLKIETKKKNLPIYSYFMKIEETFIPCLSNEHKNYKWIGYKNIKTQKLTTVFKPFWKIYKKFITNLSE